MNININQRDWQKLLGGGAQPGVTGGDAGIPGILGMLNQQKNPPVMTAPFNPMLNTQELINPQRMNPYSSGAYNGGNTSQYDTTSDSGMSAIMEQITKLLNEGPPNPQFSPMSLPKFDPTAFEDQAEGIVNRQYDPVIQNLRSQATATQGRAKGNQKAVGDMYNQLAAYLGQETANQNKSYDAAQQQSGQMYEDERDKIAAMYAADAAAQRKEAQRLGTEAFGTGEALAQQANDKTFTEGQLGQSKLAQNQAFEQQQLAMQDYGKAMQGAAKSEGGEAQQAIIRQLEDYMNQSDTNIANVQSQAAGSIGDLMMKLAQGTYDRDAANAQFGYQQQRDYIGDQNNLYDRNLDLMMKQLELTQAASGSGSSEKLNPWQSTASFADQLAPGQGQDYISAIQAAMSDRPEIYARSKDDPVPMTPALFAKLIAESQDAGGLDKNKLMMAAQQLYSLLYAK
jgi:hypothetical protein